MELIKIEPLTFYVKELFYLLKHGEILCFSFYFFQQDIGLYFIKCSNKFISFYLRDRSLNQITKPL